MRGIGPLFRFKTAVVQALLEIGNEFLELIRDMRRPAPEDSRASPQLDLVDGQLKGSDDHLISRLYQAGVLIRRDPAEKGQSDMQIIGLVNPATVTRERTGNSVQSKPGIGIRPEGKKEPLGVTLSQKGPERPVTPEKLPDGEPIHDHPRNSVAES